jgi:hypothetical protein
MCTCQTVKSTKKGAVIMSKPCTCEKCGCTGNSSCGAEPVDKENNCTLNQALICPCCEKLGREENMGRWKNDVS